MAKRGESKDKREAGHGSLRNYQPPSEEGDWDLNCALAELGKLNLESDKEAEDKDGL